MRAHYAVVLSIWRMRFPSQSPCRAPVHWRASDLMRLLFKCRPALVVSVRVGGKGGCDNKCAPSHAPVARYLYSGEFPTPCVWFFFLFEFSCCGGVALGYKHKC